MMTSVIVGLGKTGASCVRYLAKLGIAAAATDSRAAPPGLQELGALASSIDIRLGRFDLSLLDGATQLLISPGVSLEEPIATEARARGIPVLGDIELFAHAAGAPVIGVTGTNGKSTVTSLVAHMATAAGRRVLAGGNLGRPALDLLEEPVPDLYVLELSSFQLETTSTLELAAAAVLNVTADHMDRYPSIDAYAQAKARIFARAATVVLNADDLRVSAMRRTALERAAGRVPPRIVTFSVGRGDADFTVAHHGSKSWLSRGGQELLDVARMKISGVHNIANALAALALGEAAGLPMAAMRGALETFPGLKHRSEFVADIAGVRYVNDSKGTNVGATIAAVAGLEGPLVLIAGGEGKGQDFAPLAAAFGDKVRRVVLIGKDAPVLDAALAGVCPTERAATLPDAVRAAAAAAKPGDTVLLSPACASLDMFRDYNHRGEVFAASVRALASAAESGSIPAPGTTAPPKGAA